MSLNRRDFVAGLGLVAGAVGSTAAQAQAEELPTSSRELWDFARQQPVIEQGLTWLDSAYAGPSLRRVLIEEYRHREALSANRPAYYRENLTWGSNADSAAGLPAVVQGLASFLGCGTEELTFTSGCSEALGLVAAGLDLVADDEILTTRHEHNAAIYPWLLQAKRRGVRVVQVSLPSPLPHPQHVVDAFAAAMTPRTRVVAFSHIQRTDGSVLPARELCDLARSRNALSLVDGAQALGMIPVAVRELGCDFYAANLHKWLNACAGAGVLYLRSEAVHRVWPSFVAGHDSWDATDRDGLATSTTAEYRNTWPTAMRKFDYAMHHRAPVILSALPALRFQRDIGTARIAARIRELSWYLRLQLQRVTGVRILTSPHPQLWAGIVAFQVPGMDSASLAQTLLSQHRIAVRSVAHPAAGFDAVRVSTHIYNSHDHVDRLIGALGKLVR